MGLIAQSSAFRALDTHDLRRRFARVQDTSRSRLHFAHSTRTISAEGCPRAGKIALSPAFRALNTHDLRRGLRRTGSKRTLACVSRPRHARSPQRVACDRDKTHALSLAFRALDTHDLRRGLRRTKPNRTLACVSRTRHARSPQRAAFRGAPAAPPPALREKVKKSEMDVKMSRDVDVQMRM